MRRGGRVFGCIPRLPVRTVLFLAVGLGVTALGLVAYGTDVAAQRRARQRRRALLHPRHAEAPEGPDRRADRRRHVQRPARSAGRSRAPCTPTPSTTSTRTTRRRSPTTSSSPSRATERTGTTPGPRAGRRDHRANGRVVLATTEVDDKGGTAIFGGDDNLPPDPRASGQRALPQRSGRRDPARLLRDRQAQDLRGGDHRGRRPVARCGPSSFDGHTAWIDYSGRRARSRRSRSRASCRARCRAASSATRSSWSVPRRRRSRTCTRRRRPATSLMSGAEIQANAIETVRRGLPLAAGAGGRRRGADRAARARGAAGQPAPRPRCGRSPCRSSAAPSSSSPRSSRSTAARSCRSSTRSARCCWRRSARSRSTT